MEYFSLKNELIILTPFVKPRKKWTANAKTSLSPWKMQFSIISQQRANTNNRINSMWNKVLKKLKKKEKV